MRLSKFSRKLVAFLCAIAMVVSSFVFTPSTDVNAAQSETVDGITYTVTDGAQGDWTGIVTQGIFDKARIHWAWDKAVDPASITITVDGKEVTALGTNANGVHVTIASVKEAVNSQMGNYTIKITAVSTESEELMWTADLKMEEAAPTTTGEPGVVTWVDIPNSDGLQYDDSTTAKVINVQQPGWSGLTQAGVYVEPPSGAGAPTSVSINGEETAVVQGDNGTFFVQGAGILYYLTSLTAATTTIEVEYAAYGSSTLVIKNTKAEETTEAPTEAPTEETTEAPTEETTEAPTEESTEAPSTDWLSAKDQWVLRKDDGSFDVIADGGATYDGFEGIASFYSGSWGGGDVDVKTPASTDPNKLDIRVNSVGTGDWSMQVHINKTGLDATKAYSVTLTAGETTLLEETVSEISTYAKTVNLANKLAVGETTLVLDIEEQTMPPAPVVQDITITPNEAQIETNYNIWASWTNPTDTTKAYAYLKQADAGYDVMAANGWDFNTQATQPMTSVDNVDHSKNNEVKVEEGGTYVFIVDTYDAWNRPTGHGEIEITIPSLTPEEKEAKEYLGKINTAENLALNKTPIVASHDNDGKNIVDGNNGSRWQADKTVDNTSFAVDLESVVTVDKVLVSWEASNARAYEVYLAGEDQEYGTTPVATVTGLPNNTAVYRLSKDIDTEARYVKVVVTEWSQNAQDYGISPYELAVFGAETPTESTSEQPSTESPTGETETPTSSGDIDMNIDLTPTNWTDFGGYTVFLGDWDNVTAKAGIDANNSDHVKIQIKSTTDWDKWGLQLKKTVTGLDANATYTVEWTIKADNNDGALQPNFANDMVTLTGATQTLTGSKQADGDGILDLTIGAGQVGIDNAIEYQQPIIKDAQGNVVYPSEEPTTEAPTEESTEAPSESPTVEPSTEAPSEVTTEAPTAEPTTQAPTQKPTQKPTVKPTTTKEPKPTTKKVKKPGKAKVKKAIKKKKSAKKIKVTLKKVKRAKGYQVAVYKSKKKAKKNKKALVKKFTKKLKFTLKSKKFKNKKKLYVKARAYVLKGRKKVYGKWSKVKKTKKK